MLNFAFKGSFSLKRALTFSSLPFLLLASLAQAHALSSVWGFWFRLLFLFFWFSRFSWFGFFFFLFS